MQVTADCSWVPRVEFLLTEHVAVPMRSVVAHVQGHPLHVHCQRAYVRFVLRRVNLLVQITYWDAYDGQAIRIIEGSESAQVNALATDPEAESLLSGGSDKLVKLWGYVPVT